MNPAIVNAIVTLGQRIPEEIALFNRLAEVVRGGAAMEDQARLDELLAALNSERGSAVAAADAALTRAARA